MKEKTCVVLLGHQLWWEIGTEPGGSYEEGGWFLRFITEVVQIKEPFCCHIYPWFSKIWKFFFPPKSHLYNKCWSLIEMGGCLNLDWIFIMKNKNKNQSWWLSTKIKYPSPQSLEKEDGAQKVSLPEEQHVMCVCVCVCVHTIMGTTTTKFVVG